MPGQQYTHDASHPDAREHRETILGGLREWGLTLADGLDPVEGYIYV